MIIETGDILLFKGRIPVLSSAIRWFTDSDYTHVGMATTPGWVYEIDVHKQLAMYPIGDRDFDVFRSKQSLTIQQKDILLQETLSRAKQNKGYDWTHACSFAFEKFIKEFPFIMDEPNRMICSEIIDHLFHNLGIDLLPDRPLGHVSPAHLSKSPYLEKLS